jgi:hypothetical protein
MNHNNLFHKGDKNMNKLLFVFTLLLLTSGITFGQELDKGTLVGVHTFNDVKLAPGATMEQFVNAYNTKLIPALEKALTGWKCYLIKRIRGDNAPTYGVMIVISSEKERDKYYNADGTDSELGKAANKTIEPAVKEMEKFGTMPNDRYIDWLIY